MCRNFDILSLIKNFKHIDILYADVDPKIEIGRERRRKQYELEMIIEKEK